MQSQVVVVGGGGGGGVLSTCRGLISTDSGCGGGSGMPGTVVVSRRCRRLNSIKCLRRKEQEIKRNPPPNL